MSYVDSYNARKYSLIAILITTMIWGFTFIAQSEGAKIMEPFSFNAIRFSIGAVTILPISLIRSSRHEKSFSFWAEYDDKKTLLKGAFLDGIAIFIGLGLQQIGIAYTTPGKAAFLISLSIIFVPLIGLFLGEKIKKVQWLGVFLALIGVGLLSLKSDFTINFGDFIMMVAAFFLAIHMRISGYFNKNVESLKYTMFRFIAAAIFCTVLAISIENTTIYIIKKALPTLLFTGILSSGIAFTLQSVAQIHLDDLTIAFVLSLESVFGAIFAWMILGETLTKKELLGCILVFISVVFIQVIEGRNEKTEGIIDVKENKKTRLAIGEDAIEKREEKIDKIEEEK